MGILAVLGSTLWKREREEEKHGIQTKIPTKTLEVWLFQGFNTGVILGLSAEIDMAR